MEIIQLELDIIELQDIKTDLTIEIAEMSEKILVLNEDIINFNDDLFNEREIKAGLEKDLVTAHELLENKQTELSSKMIIIHTLENQIDDLERQLDNMEIEYDAFDAHEGLAPQERSEYNISGYWLESGQIYDYLPGDTDQFLIEFPNIDDCFALGEMVGTGSMKPFLGRGHQIVKTTCFNNEDISVGDIITFNRNEIAILHQVIEVHSDGVTTKGFANSIDDGLVFWSDITGIVVAIIY